MTWKCLYYWIGVLSKGFKMQAFAANTDLARYYHEEFPASVRDIRGEAGLDDALLPEKSESHKEIDRHEYYFKFADDAKTKLESRGLWVKKTGDSNEFEAKPDAREELKNAFSGFLTSFVSFGANNEIAKPKDLASGLISACIGGAAVITGSIFAFNTIVANLRKAFPTHNAHLDQAGKFAYQLVSAFHTLAATIQPIVHQAIPFQSNEIILAVLVTVEILLGFYGTVTATEASLARNLKKSEILSSLISNKKLAQDFFNKSVTSEKATGEEAVAYEKFMAAIGKLDQLSGETAFGTLVAATSAIKETIWWSGSLAGNETTYKNLASAEIAVSGAELVGTAVSELGVVLIANIIDLIHGVVVFCRCDEKISKARDVKKELSLLFKESVLPAAQSMIQGIARLFDRKIQDEEFEKGFSVARILKALLLVVTGIAAIALIACAIAYTFPIWLAAGIISGLFFLILIARTIRSANRVKDEKIDEEFFNKHKPVDLTAALENSVGNRHFLLESLSISLIDQEEPDEVENKINAEQILMTLGFNEIELNILRNIARSNEERRTNIDRMKTQLTRMLDLKIAGV
jgi:hypothetical protein